MSSTKYIGMDVHTESISIALRNLSILAFDATDSRTRTPLGKTKIDACYGKVNFSENKR